MAPCEFCYLHAKWCQQFSHNVLNVVL